MKKFLTSLFLTASLLFTSLTAFAENFTYRVYNPRTNKSITVELGTMGVTSSQYIYGFYTTDGKPYAIVNFNTNKNNQGLIGGKCLEFNAFNKMMSGEQVDLSKYEMSWRECSTDTFYREVDCIKRERAAQGKYEFQGE